MNRFWHGGICDNFSSKIMSFLRSLDIDVWLLISRKLPLQISGWPLEELEEAVQKDLRDLRTATAFNMRAAFLVLALQVSGQTTSLPDYVYDEYYDFDLSLLGLERGRKHRKAKRAEAKERAQAAKEAAAMAAILENEGQG